MDSTTLLNRVRSVLRRYGGAIPPDVVTVLLADLDTALLRRSRSTPKIPEAVVRLTGPGTRYPDPGSLHIAVTRMLAAPGGGYTGAGWAAHSLGCSGLTARAIIRWVHTTRPESQGA